MSLKKEYSYNINGVNFLFRYYFFYIFSRIIIALPSPNTPFPALPPKWDKIPPYFEIRTIEYLVEYEGKRVTSLKKAFKNACDKADIAYPVRMYDFRHLYATMMLNAGADLAAVSKLMGHSRISTTANNYYETRSSEMKRAVSLLPKLPKEEEGGLVPFGDTETR